jgi:hypothetical protein
MTVWPFLGVPENPIETIGGELRYVMITRPFPEVPPCV